MVLPLEFPVILRNTNVFGGEDGGADVLTFFVELFSNKGQVQEHLFTISKDLPVKTNGNECFGIKTLSNYYLSLVTE